MKIEHGSRSITLHSVRHGQPRPYADSEDVYILEIQMWIEYGENPGWKPYPITKPQAFEIAQAIIGGSKDVWRPRNQRHPLDKYLAYFEALDGDLNKNDESDKWSIKFVEPYND